MRVRSALAAVTTTLLTLAPSAPAAAHDYGGPSPDVDARRHPIGRVAPADPSAHLTSARFAPPTPGRPQRTTFSAVVTRNPHTAALLEPGFTTPADPCAAPLCREVAVDVPEGGRQTLYARAAWSNRAQYAHLWGIGPDGTVVGRAQVYDSFDKTTGNERTVPVAEFTVADPRPGQWRVQVRAVFGHRVAVSGLVSLAAGRPVSYPRIDVRTLADRHLTQRLTMNIVFVGREWSEDEVARFRASMPTEYRPAVFTQIQDECGIADNNGIFAVQSWKVCHFTGTEREGAPGAKPYFEPLKFTFDYRFLEADARWTRDLFEEMQARTKQARPFRVGVTGPLIPSGQAAYLSNYDATQGRANRGPSAAVADPTVGDKIDAVAVEDWVFRSRVNPRYAKSFRDLETGRRVSGRFITPDPDARYDPFYERGGRPDLETMPQGPTTSLTFFVLDTFSDRDVADQYFRPNAYHFFDVSERMKDPDTGFVESPDFARVWGGRYHFFLHDLGAGPNYYEAASSVAGTFAGSASYPDGDPPIWDYENDPRWRGLLPARTARAASTMLFYRFVHSYAYRPVPADVYLLASNVWHDCYANPQCSADGIAKTDLRKIYRPAWVERNLSAALPGATFLTERSVPGLTTFRELGCAALRAVANPTRYATGPDTTVLAPDPNCVGKPSDPIQQVLERAKANGDDLVGPGVSDFSVSAHVVRQWVEENRALVAPQPPGQFTVTNISVVFPGAVTWFLPLPTGGGIALGTPNGEAWGIVQNVNDVFKPSAATECAKSKPYAPGCGVVPGNGNGGLSYVTQHEAAHFIGLNHPHDSLVVEQDADGKWQYYGYSYRHYGDFSQSPTTYAGPFAPYSVIDQDVLQRGHTAEYLRQAQDWLADAHLLDGAAGLAGPSKLTRRKVAETGRWVSTASALFRCGDYLKAERAMRNASLTAQGVFGPVVPARRLRPNERVLLRVLPQQVYGPDGQRVPGCAWSHQRAAPAVTRPAPPAGGLPDALPLVVLAALAAGVARRRRSVPRWGTMAA